jgi:hypothetical protein
MLTLNLWSVCRCMALLLLLWTANNATAQSTLSTIPQQAQANGENRVVTKSNNVTNSAMNKVDSASNKAFKSFTGLFKKKNKKKAADSTAVHAPDSTTVHSPDSTAAPKTSSFIRPRPMPNDLLRPESNPALDQKNYYFKNAIIETYQS